MAIQRRATIFGVMTALLVGCSSNAPQAQIVREVTVEVPATVAVFQTVEVPVTVVVAQTVEVPVTVIVPITVQAPTASPTASAIPPTPTTLLEPTAVNAPLPPTSAPASKWSAMQVIEAFRQAGLEAEGARAMTVQDYGAAPMRAEEAVRFLIPSLGEGSGGRVFRCATQDDLETMKAYYVELGKSSAWFFSWVFAQGDILVQINGELPEEQARQYEAVLEAMQ